MSTSVIEYGSGTLEGIRKVKREDGKNLWRIYLGAALFILVFSRIYDYFGHGVSSLFMDLAWLVPFSGFLWYRVLRLTERKTGYISDNASGAGCATLTCAFLLKGIFEIAGTSSPYLPLFFWMGGILTALGILAALIGWIRIRP